MHESVFPPLALLALEDTYAETTEASLSCVEDAKPADISQLSKKKIDLLTLLTLATSLNIDELAKAIAELNRKAKLSGGTLSPKDLTPSPR